MHFRLGLIFIFTILASRVLSQNGTIISKKLIELRTDNAWAKIAPNDTLLSKYSYVEKINLYEIIYLSDSLEIKGYLCEPKDTGVYPAIIYNRGGNKDFGSLTAMSILSVTGRLAAEGYVILASQYREAKGAKGKDEFGGNDLNDILNITITAKGLANVDTTRMGLFGWSRGGMMTYLTLQKTDIFKTAVITNGVSNMIKSAANRPNMEKNVYSVCIPNYWENRREELKKRSVIFWADELPCTTSYLIICGSEDTLVSPANSRKIAKKLERLDYEIEFHEFETDHKFSNKKDEIYDLLLRWFDEKLCAFVPEDF